MSAYTADIDRCDCNSIHEDVISDVREKLPDDDNLIDLADLFKVLGDSTRVKILSALSIDSMCVCDIAVLLGMTKSSISHQLRVLKQAKLVEYRRDGKIVYYSLADDHVRNIFEDGLNHVLE